MNPAPHQDVDRLLSEAGWARALARSLVRDVHAADDLVQRAYVAALERPPEPGTPVRRWLAAVMRNFAISDARTASRRAVRERASARGESQPPADPVDEGLALQERLLHAVRELAEPYRSTVWARYYDGLAPRAIAARDGVPLKTVKTRLARGLDQLRARFDREHGGDRAAWVLAFLPLVEPRSWSAWTLGTLLVDAKLKIALVVALAAAGLGVWWAAQDPAAPEEGLAVAARTDSAAPLATPPQSTLRTEAATPDDAPPGPEAAASAVRAAPANAPTVRGLVVDVDERPVAGATLLDAWSRTPVIGEHGEVQSGADGRFAIDSPRRLDVVAAGGPGRVPLYASQVAGNEERLVLVVAPEAAFAGRVVDANGDPVTKGTVTIALDPELSERLVRLGPGATEVQRHAEIDAQGRFELLHAPLVRGALVAEVPGRRPARLALPEVGRNDITIALSELPADSVLLRGVVTDATGRPAAGAWVGVLHVDATTESLEDGSFALELPLEKLRAAAWTTTSPTPPAGPQPLELRAVLAGALPARQVLPEFDVLPGAALATEFRLALGGPSLRIAGVVVDSAGEPVELAEVRRVDEEEFGLVRPLGAQGRFDHQASFEALMDGLDSFGRVQTDAEGRFELSGLLDRAYRLTVTSSERVARVETEPIAAGRRDVRLVLPTGGERADVAGRVVDAGGAPVNGAHVIAMAVPVGGGERVQGPLAVTDGDGRFRLASIPRGGLTLQVHARGFRWREQRVGADEDPGALVVVLWRDVRVQVDLGDRADLADAFEVLDEHGDPLEVYGTLMRMSEGSSTTTITSATRWPIPAGRSEVLTVTEGRRTVVLYRGATEVARLPAELRGGDLNVVRP